MNKRSRRGKAALKLFRIKYYPWQDQAIRRILNLNLFSVSMDVPRHIGKTEAIHDYHGTAQPESRS